MGYQSRFGLRVGVIGCGERGAAHLLSLQRTRFAHAVAAADLYDGRLQRAREITGDPNLSTTRDYRDVLARKDLDAVILAVPDFALAPIFTAAVAAVRGVYCEAPFGFAAAQGEAMLAAARRSRALVQMGTGVPSAPVCQRAKTMLASGRLGTIYQVLAVRDIGTSMGAWRAPYPPDASPETVDWNRFEAPAARKQAFSLPRFFRWRCYRDYGAGVAADALMDALTAFAWLFNPGTPESARAAGGNFRWRDGRETPDIFRAAMNFPDYQLDLNCSMVTSAGGHKLRICGGTASLELEDSRGGGFDVLRLRPEPAIEPYVEAVANWPASGRDFFYMEHGLNASGTPMREPGPGLQAEEWREAASGVGGNPDADAGSLLDRHLASFLAAVAGRGAVVEPPELGAQAAGLAHRAEQAWREAAAGASDPARHGGDA